MNRQSPTQDQTAGRQYLTATEAARLLNVQDATIVRAIQRGRLPALRLGRIYKIARDDLDRYLAHDQEAAPPTTDPALLTEQIETLLVESASESPHARPKVVAALRLTRQLRQLLADQRKTAAVLALLTVVELVRQWTPCLLN